MTLAEKLNVSGIYPDFMLRTQDRAVELAEYGINELGCYAQYPLEDAKIYVRSVDGQTAHWSGLWVRGGDDT